MLDKETIEYLVGFELQGAEEYVDREGFHVLAYGLAYRAEAFAKVLEDEEAISRAQEVISKARRLISDRPEYGQTSN